VLKLDFHSLLIMLQPYRRIQLSLLLIIIMMMIIIHW